jgi:uncharacterized repeat protein (TIGR01451 family)
MRLATWRGRAALPIGFIFAIGALLTSVAPVAAVASECDALAGNLVTNCGFETGDFTGWTLGGDTSFTGVVNNPHTGTFAEFAGPTGGQGSISQTVTTVAGRWYAFRFYVLGGASSGAHFDAQLTNNAAPVTVVTYDNVTLGSWTQTTYTFQAATTSATVTFHYQNVPTFWFLDDVAVVLVPPNFTKAFGAPTIPLNGATTLTFTLTNPAGSIGAVSGVGFTDTLPSGLVVATPNGLTGSCGGGTITATAGSSTVSLSGASLAVGASCAFTVNVQGTTKGVKPNTTGNVSSTEFGSAGTASDTLTVVAPPTISKSFSPSTINLNDQSSLSFTITNPNSTVALTGVGFTDNLPAGIVISTPSGLTGSCGGGTITAADGTTTISLSGATLAASASCTFSLNVVGISPGGQVNTTGAVTSANGGTGLTATATLTVLRPTDLAISKTHTGNFRVGQTGVWTIGVTNIGDIASSGLVTVDDTMPGGITVTGVSASGWNCTWTSIRVTCTRSNSLGAGASYPNIDISVRPSLFAVPSATNFARVKGGGDQNKDNNLAIDKAIVTF